MNLDNDYGREDFILDLFPEDRGIFLNNNSAEEGVSTSSLPEGVPAEPQESQREVPQVGRLRSWAGSALNTVSRIAREEGLTV